MLSNKYCLLRISCKVTSFTCSNKQGRDIDRPHVLTSQSILHKFPSIGNDHFLFTLYSSRSSCKHIEVPMEAMWTEHDSYHNNSQNARIHKNLNFKSAYKIHKIYVQNHY